MWQCKTIFTRALADRGFRIRKSRMASACRRGPTESRACAGASGPTSKNVASWGLPQATTVEGSSLPPFPLTSRPGPSPNASSFVVSTPGGQASPGRPAARVLRHRPVGIPPVGGAAAGLVHRRAHEVLRAPILRGPAVSGRVARGRPHRRGRAAGRRPADCPAVGPPAGRGERRGSRNRPC